jgi:hypothetical protein
LYTNKGSKLIQILPVSKAIVVLLGTIKSKTTRRGRKKACNWCIVFIPVESTIPAGEEETRCPPFGDADEKDLQMLKVTVMIVMKTIPTFITNIMPSAEKAADAAMTICGVDLATASVNDNTQHISWLFLNLVMSLMVE